MLYSLFWLLWPIVYAGCATSYGIFTYTDEAFIIHLVGVLAGCLLPLRGLWYVALAKRNKVKIKPRMLVQTFIELALSLSIIFISNLSYNAFLVFLCIYSSFYATVQGINAFIYGRNRVFQYFIPSLCQSALFFHIIIGILFLPDDIRYNLVIGGTGFLLSMLGQAYLFDWLSVVVKNKKAAEAFRKISITMPGFSGLGVPTRLIGTINEDKKDIKPDAEIIFNYGKSGKGIAGHCELCVDGMTYTYGNYDQKSQAVLHTLGNGIIFRAQKERYIDFLVKQDRTVVVYGLKFDDKQRRRFDENIATFKSKLIGWEKEAQSTASEDYIHQVIDALDAKVFRINEGRFKTYFLPTINCVTLTGNLLKGTHAGNVVVPGVYTPGAYMDALHRLYIAGDDVVVSVSTYNA